MPVQPSGPTSVSSTAHTGFPRWRQLVFVICIAVIIAALCSHMTVRLLKIKASWGGNKFYGATSQKASNILYGSSVANYGIYWPKVSEAFGNPIVSWASPGSSPSEWEHTHRHSVDVSRSFIVVSPVDLNEYTLCDFRAEIVPLSQSIRDLWNVSADWPFSKIVLSQYPIKAVRILFPTVGRSDGVMTGIRDQIKRLAGRGSSGEAGEAVGFGLEDDLAPDDRLSNWTPGRFQRRMVGARAQCQGKYSFNGIKKAALMRIFQKAHEQGEVIWIVIPVAPSYQKEFLTPAVREDFEKALTDLQRSWPKAKMVRLDQLPLLQDDGMFFDFVHLNRYGQKIATDAFLAQLEKGSNRP